MKDTYHVENTTGGVSIMQRNATGDYEPVTLIAYGDVMPRLDAGEWDENEGLALKIIQSWGKAVRTFTDTEILFLWRWLIAQAFILEQQKKNGSVSVEWQPGEFRDCAIYRGQYGAMNLYLSAERLAMATNIEGALIENYGTEQGTKNAIQFYMNMRGDNGGLSEWGSSLLSELHDGFIQQVQKSGMPDAPVVH